MKTRLIVCLILGLLLGQGVKAQTFTITSPAAGATFYGLSVVRVTWDTYPTIEQMGFFLSLDGGVTYPYGGTYYDPSGPATYFDILLPNCSSNNCKLAISVNTGQTDSTHTSATFSILPFPTPTLSIIMPTDTTVCQQTTLNLASQISGGQPPYKLVWTTSNYASLGLLCDSCNTLSYDNEYFNAGTITLVVTDANGKTGFDSIQVHQYPYPHFDVWEAGSGGAVACGATDTIGPVYLGGAQVQSYAWYQWPDSHTIIGDSLNIAVQPPAGTTAYVLFGTDQYGCYLCYDTAIFTSDCHTIPVLANNDCYQLGTPDSTVGGYAYFSLHILDNDVYDTTDHISFYANTNPAIGSLVNTSFNSNFEPVIYGGSAAYNYFILKVPVAALAAPDSFQYVLYDPSGSSTAWVRINTPCPTDAGLVWPGDTRDDGYVDNTSLLPIGIGYGTSGAIRSGATINWTGQNCSNWTDSLATGSNYKYIDCNGDGIINADDTMAIHNNFFLVHARSGGLSSGIGAPALSIKPVEDTVFDADTL